MAAYERRRRRIRPAPEQRDGVPPEGVDASEEAGAVGAPAALPEPPPTPGTAVPSTTSEPSATRPVSPGSLRPTSPAAPQPTSPAALRSGAWSATKPTSGAGTRADDPHSERGLRGLVGSGSSQVSVGAALRARDAARPTEEHLAEAEARLVIVRRNWVPREDLPRR
jgi:hypothetical protein